MYKDNPQTAYKQELKEKILTSSMHEFLIHGVKSVRMEILPILSVSPSALFMRFIVIKKNCFWKEFVSRKRSMTVI